MCRRRGLAIVKRNHRWTGGEIDLLVTDRLGQWIVIEVRGRVANDYRPSLCLSDTKRRRLLTYASFLGVKARVELWEILGAPPRNPFTRWVSCLRPEWFGMKLRIYRVD